MKPATLTDPVYPLSMHVVLLFAVHLLAVLSHERPQLVGYMLTIQKTLPAQSHSKAGCQIPTWAVHACLLDRSSQLWLGLQFVWLLRSIFGFIK